MKAAPLLVIALIFACVSTVWGVVMPTAPNPEPSPQSFAMSLFGQPGTNPNALTYDGKFNFFSGQDKEHVYTIDPSPLYDLSNQPVNNPGYTSALSPDVQKNIGIQIAIPLFGNILPNLYSKNELSRSGEIGAARR